MQDKSEMTMRKKTMGLVLHGGAGPDSEFIRSHREQHLDSLLCYAKWGHEMLEMGKGATEVVKAVVALLEDDALFNAGRGSALGFHGDIEMDACLMDGSTGGSGSVCSVSLARNPIELAELVMRRTSYMLLAGSGADLLAKELVARIEERSYFVVEERLRGCNAFRSSPKDPWSIGNRGTVGAVALDTSGNLAAGTSTGGITGKLSGRVSDSCIVGAGCYAQNGTCAVSGTGEGEFLMSESTALSIFHAETARPGNIQGHCCSAVHRQRSKRADMGVIGLDCTGEVGISFNSQRMFRAWCGEEGANEARNY